MIINAARFGVSTLLASTSSIHQKSLHPTISIIPFKIRRREKRIINSWIVVELGHFSKEKRCEFQGAVFSSFRWAGAILDILVFLRVMLVVVFMGGCWCVYFLVEVPCWIERSLEIILWVFGLGKVRKKGGADCGWILTKDVVSWVFKSLNKSPSDVTPVDEWKAVWVSLTSAGLFICFLDFEGTLATRRDAIPYSSWNILTVGVAANDDPGWTEWEMKEVIDFIKRISLEAFEYCGVARIFAKRMRLALIG